MQRLKNTVLKTTLDRELAAEYGVEGLTACPMLKAGQVFYADYQSLKACVMRPGRRSISMYLLWPTEREQTCFIMATGSASPA